MKCYYIRKSHLIVIKNIQNNNKAYLIEYLQMQQNQHYQGNTNDTSNNKYTNSASNSPNLHQTSSMSSIALNNQQTAQNNVKKSMGSMPPLPPTSQSNQTPRNKSKDGKNHHFKLSSQGNNSSISNLSNSSSGSGSVPNQIKKIFSGFNRKAHSKDLESLASDSSAPALKSITRSPSPSFSNYTSTASFNGSSAGINKLNTSSTSSNLLNTNAMTTSTSDYSSTLSRNNSANNLNVSNENSNNQFDTSLAKMGLQDQHQFAGEHVLKIYKNDQNFKYLVVHKETSTKEVVMLALNEFNIVDEIGSR